LEERESKREDEPTTLIWLKSHTMTERGMVVDSLLLRLLLGAFY